MNDRTEELLIRVREIKKIADGKPCEDAMLAQACLDDVRDILDEDEQ